MGLERPPVSETLPITSVTLAAMSKGAIGRLELVATAVLFSTGGAAIKATALTGWQTACFRSGIAAIAVLLLAPAARRNWGWRPALVGVAYSATMVMFVTANKLTTAANTIFLQYTAPLYLLIISPLLLKERVRRADLLLMVVLAAGIGLFLAAGQPASATAPDPFRGDVIAAASGIAWALTIAGLRWLESRGAGAGAGAGMTTVAMGNLITFLACLPMSVPVARTATADWLVMGYLGLFQIGLAYVLLTRAVGKVPALEASLLLLIEPALNPAWAWLVHGERPVPLALAGAALILAGTAARVYMGRGANSRVPSTSPRAGPERLPRS